VETNTQLSECIEKGGSGDISVFGVLIHATPPEIPPDVAGKLPRTISSLVVVVFFLREEKTTTVIFQPSTLW